MEYWYIWLILWLTFNTTKPVKANIEHGNFIIFIVLVSNLTLFTLTASGFLWLVEIYKYIIN